MNAVKKSLRFWFLRILRWTLGVVFLILGILGLFLPVLQGILFLAIAALLFALDFPVINRWINQLAHRFPPLKLPVRKARQWIKKEMDEKPPEEL